MAMKFGAQHPSDFTAITVAQIPLSVEKALDEALHDLGGDAQILVLPEGNDTLPVIDPKVRP